MNPWIPTVFAASFVDFRIDTNSVCVTGDKVEFGLIHSYDSDICVNGVVTGSKTTKYFTFLPEGKISPEDEQEESYPSLEVSGTSICIVTNADGVEVVRGMPFILTDNQIGVLNGELYDICELRFMRGIENFEHDSLPFELTEAWEELHLNKAGA